MPFDAPRLDLAASDSDSEEAAPAAPPGFEGVASSGDQGSDDAGAGSAAGAAADAVADTLAGASVAPKEGELEDGVQDSAADGVGIPAKGLDPEAEAAEVKLEVKVQDGIYTAAKSFDELGLSAELLKGLYAEMKFEKPSKIQAETLPMIIQPPNTNLIAQAHNGSGKTTCFTLGMLSRCDPSVAQPQALCVCPTRELVLQNKRVLEKMGKYTGLKCTTTGEARPLKGPAIDAQVVIGTPGTLKNWMKPGRFQQLNVSGIKILVFDEADQMLSRDGFADDSMRLFKTIQTATARVNGHVQVLLFSATFSESVMKFCQRVVPPPVNQVVLPREKLSLDVIKQYQVQCPTSQDKTTVLRERILSWCDKLGQAIVFCRTRERATALHKALDDIGHKCTSLQGGMEHEDRDRVIDEFREGKTKILVVTDVLSRGFDQSTVTLVVNYDAPTERDSTTPAYETVRRCCPARSSRPRPSPARCPRPPGRPPRRSLVRALTPRAGVRATRSTCTASGALAASATRARRSTLSPEAPSRRSSTRLPRTTRTPSRVSSTTMRRPSRRCSRRRGS